MNENPSLEEAMTQASESLSTESVEQTPEVEASAETTEVAPEAQEAPSQEPQEDTPLKEFDPKTLPPELKGVYDNLMKGFTQGRQKDREELNQLKQKLEAYEKAQYPQQDQPDLTPEEYVQKVAQDAVLKAKLDDFRTQALDDYNSIDPRLNNAEGNEQYDPIMDQVVGAQLDQLLDKHVEQHGNELGFDYKAHAKELIQKWDEYKQKQIDRFLENQRVLAKKSEAKMKKVTPSATTAETTPSGSMSLEEAINSAFSKIG